MLRVVEQASLTDVGRQRNANEDALFERAGMPVFAVADGMGGARAGEVAARTAVERVGDLGDGRELTEGELAEVVRDANRRIHELSRGDESLAGMGTTMTLLAVAGQEVAIAHVGDSRAYRLRDDKLERLTHDHSLVDEMVRAGKLTQAEAEVHPQRSIITRALGPESEVEVERLTYPARAGDVYLICSDGLTTMVPEEAVSSLLASSSSLKAAASDLVRAANEAGGRDNITVVLFRLGEGDAAAEEPTREQATMVAGAPGAVSAADVEEEAGRVAATRESAAPPPDATAVFDDDQRRRLRERAAERPAAPRRRRGRRWLTAAIVALALGAVVVGFWAGSRQFYFVGTDDQGLVTLYRGLPYELPLGVELWEEEYATGVPARLIPRSRRERVLDHRLRSRGDAVDLIKQVERGELEG